MISDIDFNSKFLENLSYSELHFLGFEISLNSHIGVFLSLCGNKFKKKARSLKNADYETVFDVNLRTFNT